MKQNTCQLQEAQSLLKIQKEFLERMLEVCNFQDQDISKKLLLILNEKSISFDQIKQIFNIIQDEKQLNQITSICNEYLLRYQTQKKQIEEEILQSTLNSTEILEIPTQRNLNLNKLTIENQYQQIQKEGINKISQMIQPNLDSGNLKHIDSFVEYLIQKIDHLDQKESQFQEILDNLDLTFKQQNQILQIWEEYRLRLKEKKDLIDMIQDEISKVQEKSLQNKFEVEEKKQEDSIELNSIKSLQNEIQVLQIQINQLIEEFQQYLTSYLQDNCDVINLEDINQLVEKLNLDAELENESNNIDKIIQTFDLTFKQEKQIKTEFQKFSEEIMKRKVIIKQNNIHIALFNEQLKINQTKCQLDPKEILVNSFIKQINEISQLDWTQNYKDILEQLVCYLKNTIEQDEKLTEEKVYSIIEDANLRRSKMKQIMNEINKFILEYKQIIKNNSDHENQIQTDSNEKIQRCSILTNLNQTNKQNSNQEILICNNTNNNHIQESNLLIGKENCIQLQIDSTQNLVQYFIQKISEISQKDWNKFYNSTLKQLIIFLQTTTELKYEIAENQILEIIQNVESSKINQKEIISFIISFVAQYKQKLDGELAIYLLDTPIQQQNEDDKLKQEFRNILGNLEEQMRDICQKQIKILNHYFQQDCKQLIICQNIIVKYPGQKNFILALQEIQNIEGIQSLDIFEIYKNWLELAVDMNQNQKEFFLQLQQIHFQKNGKLIQEEYIQQLSKVNENEVENIFENLEISYRQTKELLKIWKNIQDDFDKENYQPEFLQFKQFIQSQIKDKILLTILNNRLTQNVVHLLQSSKEQDWKELKSIYDQLNLTQQQIKLIQQEFENLYKIKLAHELNQFEEINQNEIMNESKKKNDLILSEIYTLVYQQQDFCLEQTNPKVICDFQKIQELVNELKQNEIKTIGFYGDYMLSIKIIQEYYPNSKKLINLNSYQHPKYDKLVAITDGQILFLVLEEQKMAFEGDIFENDDGLLYIRYLLDSCSIFIVCLNSNQVSQWSHTNPFEQFEAIVPPKVYKNRSQLFLKQMTIYSNLSKNNNILLSNDQNNCIIMSELCLSSIKNDNQYSNYEYQIRQNRENLNRVFQGSNIYGQNLIQKIQENKKNIINIFSKNSELQNQINQTYEEFEKQIKKLQISIQIRNLIEEFLYQAKQDDSPNNPQNKIIIQDDEIFSLVSFRQFEDNIQMNNQKQTFQDQIQIQNHSILYEICCYLKTNLCSLCSKGMNVNQTKIYGCYNCYTFNVMVDQIKKKIGQIKNWKITNKVKSFLGYQELDLNQIINIISQQKEKKNFKLLKNFINQKQFYTHYNDVQNEIFNKLFLLFQGYSFDKQIIDQILDILFRATYELIQKIVDKQNQINGDLVNEKNKFLGQVDLFFNKLSNQYEERLFIYPLLFTYNPIKKDEILLSINYKNQKILMHDQAHRLIDYVSFDEHVDYIIFNNCNEKVKEKQRTSIFMLKKNNNNNLKYVFSIQGSLDIALFINQNSRQWVIFANDTKKNSIGKINSDYSFEEGRLDTNVYNCKTQQGNLIERVDSCIILNEKNNVVILYEEKKKQFYQLFLSGELKEIRFNLYREIPVDGITQIQDISLEEPGDILAIKNSTEGDFYVFQTEKNIFITNPNYIVKQQIPLKEKFSKFKLITTEDACFLLTSYQDNQYECFIIQEVEQQDDSASISNISYEKARIGNIVIDKIIKSILHYGKNQTQIGCPGLIHQLFYFENNQKEKILNFEKSINQYFSDCLVYKNIQFNISHSFKNCFGNIDLLLNKVDSLLKVVDSITVQDLQFILQTRIPIQLTTIQQSNYLPLKDGLFKQDLMNVPEVEDQIEQIKKQITFGWIENMVQLQNKEIYTVAMCGRQSVGKSSQLNRLFGTRFGVSASRCTDGIWAGLSKVEDKLILVLDCEGLFSIRRTDDEEVKLLLQITSVSDITMVFCDIDGINQPLLSLFKKLQICAGKMQSDSFFLGTMVLLTKNVSDEGDKNKIHQESQIHLNKKETKNTLSKIFNKGVAYGFLKGFQANDYDSNLQKVKDELLFKQILLKNKPKFPQFLMNILKYSMIQIYLNDDQDIDLISKQSEVKEEYQKFVELFYDISLQNFINSEKLIFLFEYKPSSNEEKLLINGQTILKFDQFFNQNIQNELSQFQLEDKIMHTNNSINSVNFRNNQEINIDDQEEKNKQQEELENNILDECKCYNTIQLNQCDIKLIPQQSQYVMADKKSQNFENLENIFQGCFKILQRQNFNNYVDQMQNFFNSFVEQRRNTILEYFNNRIPKEQKYRDIVHKFEQKINIILHSLDMQLVFCRQKCSICDRVCVNILEHKGDCNCETSHKCYFKCQICKSENECFLISGHKGAHFCKEINHLCLKFCQISISCKELCTLEPHLDDIKHSCQGGHKCEYQCRLYDKCGKSCSLQSGHDEINHLCDSTQCYDKCDLCDKLCGFSLHDHDILLQNIEKNKDRLMKDGKLVTKHLCGDSHCCLEKCQKPGVCSITYKAEEKIWETKSSRFEYQFIKPQKNQKQCSVLIEPWQISHDGEHHCESSQPHRCESQCPECLSYCLENYNHSGNHKSKNHRNKENCIFVSETDQIKINNEKGNVRSYLPGESSTPENCLQSCLRMGRAHVHLRLCKGGDECAEKKYSFARHSKKKYKPFTYLQYDEMLCKGYWNSINWEPPAEDENIQIIQSCNSACSHESHKDFPNYCIKLAWHEGEHQIDHKKCEHLRSRIVDICFTIDTTSSMQWAMSKVSQAVNSILEMFEGKADIMYSVVSYRDHPPQDKTYIYKIDSQLTDYNNIQNVLQNMIAQGGGDTPEAVMDGLFYSLTKIQWRDKSQRFIFHICDSPPHGKKFGCQSKDLQWTQKGCPCGINEYKIAEQLKKQQVFYYLVKVNSSLNMMEDIFKSTFGSFFKQTIELQDTNKLNIEISQALSKEIYITNEYYHLIIVKRYPNAKYHFFPDNQESLSTLEKLFEENDTSPQLSSPQLSSNTNSTSQNPQIENFLDLENAYEQIQKEGIAKVSQLIMPNLETAQKPHLDSFIIYLASNIADICKKSQSFQEILDNLDLSSKQLKQILNVWEEFRVKLKEIQDQINNIKIKIDQANKNNNQNNINEKEKNEGETIQSNIQSNIKKEIEELQEQIVKLIQKFQEYLKNNLQDRCTNINFDDVNQLLKQLNFETSLENESEGIDQLIEEFDLSRKQDKEVKSEFQKYSAEDLNISQIYTITYQQQDHCLDQISLKVICDFQKIQELISQLKYNYVKTIAFYGDFKLSIKIIQKYYPNLDEKQVSCQSNSNLFEQFEATVPPKEYKDRSSMFLKQITINQRQYFIIE
ncbi:hypothetical protein ABPG72_022105 [Tetrahymena utriculariae]